MNQQTKRLLNIILFQVGWWSCFLAAAQNYSLWPLGIVILLIISFHFFLIVEKEKRVRELLFFIFAAFLGYLGDSLFFKLDIVRFSSSLMGLAPLWMFAMWVIFPMAIGHSFSWLEKRYILTFLVGAIGAPLSYRFGTSFDLIYFDTTKNLVLYGLYWGVLMNVMVSIKQINFFRGSHASFS